MTSRVLRETTVQAQVSKPVKPSGRKVHTIDKTASLTEPHFKISREHSEIRVNAAISNFLIDATIREVFKVKMLRGHTSFQGAACDNTKYSPSKENAARHTDPHAAVSCDLEEFKNVIVERVLSKGELSPNAAKELKYFKCPPKDLQEIENHPDKVVEILGEVYKHPIDLYKGSHYGYQKDTTISSLRIANQFDSKMERELRPLWDDLCKKQVEKNLSAIQTTLEYSEKQIEILKETFLKIKKEVEDDTKPLEQFFEAEQKIFEIKNQISHKNPVDENVDYVQFLKTMLQVKNNPPAFFSKSSITKSLQNRRRDWSIIEQIVKNPTTLQKDIFSLKSSDVDGEMMQKEKRIFNEKISNFKEEASYQYEAALQFKDPSSLLRLQARLFGTFDPKINDFVMPSGKELKNRLLKMLSPVKPRPESKLASVKSADKENIEPSTPEELFPKVRISFGDLFNS